MTIEDRIALSRALTPRTNKYIPINLHPKQKVLLLLSDRLEVLYGGSAGGGKSFVMLAAAAQYVDIPGYSALILRRSYRDLALPGALMAVSHQWWDGTDAKWDAQNYKWIFPSGAVVQFGYLEHEGDEYRYQSSAYQTIVFDELSQFLEHQYLYLFSRLRRPEGFTVPLRMRSASNPGGVGHCVPFGEVLTPRGWKDISEIKVGDPIYAVTESGEMVESIAEQTHAHSYEGEMVEVKGRGLTLLCTPEHRVAKVGGVRGRLRGSHHTLVPFDDLPGQATILRTVKWEGEKIGEWRLPVSVKTRRRKHAQPTTLSGENYAALMGWYLSEGYCVGRDKAFGIAQSTPEHRATIANLLIDCGFTFSTVISGFVVYAPDWWQYFRRFGHSHQKWIPRELRNASQEELYAFIDAAMDGDGHWANKDRVGGIYYTISKRLADAFAEVAVKAGYVVYTSDRIRKNRAYRTYQVSIRRKLSGGTELLTGHHLYQVGTETKRKSQITRSHYEGFVYDIGVPEHHAFVIRQNGSVWISGNSWVRERWNLPSGKTDNPERVFVSAKLDDNPYLDVKSYEESLSQLGTVTYQQLRDGDWDATISGGVFSPDQFQVIGREEIPHRRHWERIVRHWDLGSQAKSSEVPNPDFTAGCKMIRVNSLPTSQADWFRDSGNRPPPPPYYIVVDVQRFQKDPGGTEEAIRNTSAQDGYWVPVSIEQERGASGVSSVSAYKRHVLMNTERVIGLPPKGPKEQRAAYAAGRANEGRVFVVDGHYRIPFVNECSLFGIPKVHDDQVDAFSGCFQAFDKLDYLSMSGDNQAIQH